MFKQLLLLACTAAVKPQVNACYVTSQQAFAYWQITPHVETLEKHTENRLRWYIDQNVDKGTQAILAVVYSVGYQHTLKITIEHWNLEVRQDKVYLTYSIRF